ncbi:MAG: hypothetical protein J5I81_14435 [Nitrococcus mobilis]|nr:hypothetical protein [Nitrococcus mobilis]
MSHDHDNMNTYLALEAVVVGEDPATSRVVEIGCVEMHDDHPTGRSFHSYANPGRDLDIAALQAKGLSTEALADKPRFGDIAYGLICVIRDRPVIVLDAERVSAIEREMAKVIEQLKPAGWSGEYRLDQVCELSVLSQIGQAMGQDDTSIEGFCKRYVLAAPQRAGGSLAVARFAGNLWQSMLPEYHKWQATHS